MSTRTLAVRCRHCGTTLHVAGPRLTNDALRALRDHVRARHPRVALPGEAAAGAILAHFDVEGAP
jgi:hypothetical protein